MILPLAQIHPVPLAGALAFVALIALRRRHLEPPLLIGAAIGAVVLLLAGLGIVEFPNVKKLIEGLSSALGQWTYLVVGLMAFLETGAFVGLVAPGESFMLLGGVVAGQGEVSLIVLIAIGWSCAVLGDVASFYAGHRLGREFLVKHGPKFSITKERLERVDGFFDDHGGKAVFLGRFIGIVRAVNPFLAGSSGMPLRRFLPYSILGAGAWASSLLVLGYVFWQSFDRVIAVAERGALALGTTITVLVGGIWIYRYLRVPEHRDELAHWISRTLDRPVMRPVARVVRPLWRRTRALRVFIAGRLTPGELGLEVTTLHAILAVGAFGFIGNYLELRTATLIPGDERAAELAQTLRNDTLVDIARVVTEFASSAVLIPALALTCWFLLYRRMIWEAATLVAGSVLIWIAVAVTKNIVERPRPADPLIDVDGYSYPSGHAAHAVAWLAIGVVVARALPGLARPAALVLASIAVVVVVGATRVYLGAHYLSDVVGGVGLGAALYAACALMAVFADYVRQNARTRR